MAWWWPPSFVTPTVVEPGPPPKPETAGRFASRAVPEMIVLLPEAVALTWMAAGAATTAAASVDSEVGRVAVVAGVANDDGVGAVATRAGLAGAGFGESSAAVSSGMLETFVAVMTAAAAVVTATSRDALEPGMLHASAAVGGSGSTGVAVQGAEGCNRLPTFSDGETCKGGE